MNYGFRIKSFELYRTYLCACMCICVYKEENKSCILWLLRKVIILYKMIKNFFLGLYMNIICFITEYISCLLSQPMS